MATINGNGANNNYGGTNEADIIYGFGGDDTLSNGGGKDFLFGGNDNDRLTLGVYGAHGYGGMGVDTIFAAKGTTGYGDGGNDILTGRGNQYGGLGEDRLKGNGAGLRVTIAGGAGNDSIIGTGVYAYGGDGDDSIIGGTGVYAYGGDGDDTLDVSSGVYAYGGNGNDLMSGHQAQGDSGNDYITSNVGFGGAENDTLVGSDFGNQYLGDSGSDLLHGMSGGDGLYGGTESDSVYGDAGNDYVYGDAGNDKTYGGNGHDTIYGGLDNDLVNGGAGNDSLFGNEGRDNLIGGAGSDILTGGVAKDRLTGGFGRDVFVFANLGETGLGTNQDVITDFKRGVDKIDIAGLGAGLQFIRTDAFSGTAGEVRFDTTARELQIDVLGTGSADGSIQLNTTTFGVNDLIL